MPFLRLGIENLGVGREDNLLCPLTWYTQTHPSRGKNGATGGLETREAVFIGHGAQCAVAFLTWRLPEIRKYMVLPDSPVNPFKFRRIPKANFSNSVSKAEFRLGEFGFWDTKAVGGGALGRRSLTGHSLITHQSPAPKQSECSRASHPHLEWHYRTLTTLNIRVAVAGTNRH
eukprot:1164257-Amorphochlora_amoeboformis.AAC.2